MLRQDRTGMLDLPVPPYPKWEFQGITLPCYSQQIQENNWEIFHSLSLVYFTWRRKVIWESAFSFLPHFKTQLLAIPKCAIIIMSKQEVNLRGCEEPPKWTQRLRDQAASWQSKTGYPWWMCLHKLLPQCKIVPIRPPVTNCKDCHRHTVPSSPQGASSIWTSEDPRSRSEHCWEQNCWEYDSQMEGGGKETWSRGDTYGQEINTVHSTAPVQLKSVLIKDGSTHTAEWDSWADVECQYGIVVGW